MAERGRPSLGERSEYKIRVPAVVDVAGLARSSGCKNVNQYVSALLTREAERLGLIKEMSQMRLSEAS
jgi:hypothetical protein